MLLQKKKRLTYPFLSSCRCSTHQDAQIKYVPKLLPRGSLSPFSLTAYYISDSHFTVRLSQFFRFGLRTRKYQAPFVYTPYMHCMQMQMYCTLLTDFPLCCYHCPFWAKPLSDALCTLRGPLPTPTTAERALGIYFSAPLSAWGTSCPNLKANGEPSIPPCQRAPLKATVAALWHSQIVASPPSETSLVRRRRGTTIPFGT